MLPLIWKFCIFLTCPTRHESNQWTLPRLIVAMTGLRRPPSRLEACDSPRMAELIDGKEELFLLRCGRESTTGRAHQRFRASAAINIDCARIAQDAFVSKTAMSHIA